MECLENIIGLASEDCGCYPPSDPDFAEINESKSGLFISSVGDGSIPLNWADAATTCGADTVWDVLQKIRRSAIDQVVRDFNKAFGKLYKSRYRSFQDIGSRRGKTGQINKGGWVGLSVKPREIKGAVHTLSGVALNFASITIGTQVEVFVYKAVDLVTPLTSEVVQIDSTNEWYEVSFSTPIEFDLSEYSDYYVVYQVPAGARPLHNSSGSNCSFCPSSKKNNDPYKDSLEVGGVDVLDLADYRAQKD